MFRPTKIVINLHAAIGLDGEGWSLVTKLGSTLHRNIPESAVVTNACFFRNAAIEFPYVSTGTFDLQDIVGITQRVIEKTIVLTRIKRVLNGKIVKKLKLSFNLTTLPVIEDNKSIGISSVWGIPAHVKYNIPVPTNSQTPLFGVGGTQVKGASIWSGIACENFDNLPSLYADIAREVYDNEQVGTTNNNNAIINNDKFIVSKYLLETKKLIIDTKSKQFLKDDTIEKLNNDNYILKESNKNDTLKITNGNDILKVNNKNDALNVNNEIDTVSVNNDFNTVIVNNENNIINVNIDDNIIQLNNQTATVQINNENNIIVVNNENDTVQLNNETDTVKLNLDLAENVITIKKPISVEIEVNKEQSVNCVLESAYKCIINNTNNNLLPKNNSYNEFRNYITARPSLGGSYDGTSSTSFKNLSSADSKSKDKYTNGNTLSKKEKIKHNYNIRSIKSIFKFIKNK